MNTDNPPPQQPAGMPPPEVPTQAPSPLDRVRGLCRQAGRSVAGFLRRINWRIAGPVLVACLSLLVWREMAAHAKPQSAPTPQPQAVPVAAARVTRKDLYNEVTIPAEFRPYVEVQLHAKVSGYVQQMNVDFGDRVKAGQLLATIEVPELKDQLNQALATQERAEADFTNAQQIYTRLLSVVKEHPNLVAQQDLDTARAKDLSTAAAIAEAKAEAGEFCTLLAYTQITAPFDGVVTWRYVDPGALIQAGTASESTLPIVRVSDNYHLRLDFPVSVLYVKDIHVGDQVEVRVESLGGKTFTGTITRATLRVTDTTRTMITEIEVLNPGLELVPGMYCRVVLKVQRRPQVLTIPIEAVPPGQELTAYVINAQQEIEERPVKLGLGTPTDYEVTSGLKEGELVLVGRRSRVQPGQKVEPELRVSMAEK